MWDASIGEEAWRIDRWNKVTAARISHGITCAMTVAIGVAVAEKTVAFARNTTTSCTITSSIAVSLVDGSGRLSRLWSDRSIVVIRRLIASIEQIELTDVQLA